VGACNLRQAPIPTCLAGRAGPVAQPTARHEQSTGLFVSGPGPQRGKAWPPFAQELAVNNAWPRWLRRSPMELAACIVIALGIFMMLQPFALVLYTWSFLTTLAGTLMFTIVSKFPD
jgi:hypothetical protein